MCELTTAEAAHVLLLPQQWAAAAELFRRLEARVAALEAGMTPVGPHGQEGGVETTREPSGDLTADLWDSDTAVREFCDEVYRARTAARESPSVPRPPLVPTPRCARPCISCDEIQAWVAEQAAQRDAPPGDAT